MNYFYKKKSQVANPQTVSQKIVLDQKEKIDFTKEQARKQWEERNVDTVEKMVLENEKKKIHLGSQQLTSKQGFLETWRRQMKEREK